jgi:DNA-binding NarL/FixJ family response regulator
MRLDYKILWIDDQPAHVKSFQERIERHIREQGFVLDVQVVSKINDVDEAMGDHVHNDGVDLVLVDYDLGPGGGGEEALAAVRNRLRHKDILFYSASDPENLRQIAYQAKLDGIYFSTRVSLADDAISLINKTLHKVMDIDHMRGVVMAATSDIDVSIERSVLAMYGGLDEAGRTTFKQKVVDTIRTKLLDWNNDLEKANKKPGIEPIFKLRSICTAADRLNLLLGELERFSTDGKTLLETAKEYRDDMIPRRNKLAHLVVKLVGGQRVLVGNEGELDVEGMRELRCDLLVHRSNFDEISVIVDA